MVVVHRLWRRHPGAAEDHHGALYAVGSQIGIRPMELECQADRPRVVAFEEFAVVLG
jgi:hypothetical protein